jgi:hypothetical protein
MPFRKLEGDGWKGRSCLHPEHNPPTMIVLEPGAYVYTCPKCNKATFIKIPEITC